METEAPPAPDSLRHRLRATVCCCFGFGGAGAGASYRGQWRRRRGGVGEFRYDPLSYALNFDDGADGVDLQDDVSEGDAGLLYHSFSSPPRTRARTSTPAAVAVA